MRRIVAAIASLTVLASAAVSLSNISNVRGAAATGEEAVFVVPDNDGYGVADCLQSGGACGKLVAEAWCEAQGYAGAVSFGRAPADDVAIRVQAVSTRPQADRPVTVTCRR